MSLSHYRGERDGPGSGQLQRRPGRQKRDRGGFRSCWSVLLSQLLSPVLTQIRGHLRQLALPAGTIKRTHHQESVHLNVYYIQKGPMYQHHRETKKKFRPYRLYSVPCYSTVSYFTFRIERTISKVEIYQQMTHLKTFTLIEYNM